jgi:hypothetical protein
MDPDIAGAEVARVLRTGGVFGLLWSGPDRQVGWVGDLLGRTGRPSSAEDPPVADHLARRRTLALPGHLGFTERETTVVRFNLTLDLDDLAGLAGTYSMVIVGGDRDARVREVRELARRHPEVGDGPVELPMVCRCWRVYRAEGPRPVG